MGWDITQSITSSYKEHHGQWTHFLRGNIDFSIDYKRDTNVLIYQTGFLYFTCPCRYTLLLLSLTSDQPSPRLPRKPIGWPIVADRQTWRLLRQSCCHGNPRTFRLVKSIREIGSQMQLVIFGCFSYCGRALLLTCASDRWGELQAMASAGL